MQDSRDFNDIAWGFPVKNDVAIGFQSEKVLSYSFIVFADFWVFCNIPAAIHQHFIVTISLFF
jgi:hypothetical protein